MSSGDEPTQEALLDLHAALVAGDDPTASARLAELLLPALQRRFRSTSMPDPHSVDSLIGLSIARYLAEPTRYRPERGPLLGYLWQDVAGDVKNERESRTRLRKHESPDRDSIELVGHDRNLSVEEEALDAVDPFDIPQAVLDRARTELVRFSEQDRELGELLGAGVRSTAPYAEVLGIAHLPADAQRAEVKRNKDRLKARLEVIRDQLCAD